MTENDNIAINRARPAAPGPAGPSLEEQLRKVVDAEHGNQRVARAAPELAMTYGIAKDRGIIGGGGADIYGAALAKPAAGLPSANSVAGYLARTLDRLRNVDAFAGSIATVLAGPQAAQAVSSSDQPPAASLFVIYERTLDEMNRIIDNIEHEQARSRSILGD